MLSIIVAIAKNNVIGKNNELLWNIPEDMKHFKETTTGHTVIMGKRTFESIGRPLPNRKNIVIAQKNEIFDDPNGIEIVNSLEELEKYEQSEEECFVIGGAMIYKQLMPKCKKMYITLVDKEYEGDVSFPQIDEKMWKKVSETKGKECEKIGINYKFIEYNRI